MTVGTRSPPWGIKPLDYNTNSKTSSSLARVGKRGNRKAVGEGVSTKMSIMDHVGIGRRGP